MPFDSGTHKIFSYFDKGTWIVSKSLRHRKMDFTYHVRVAWCQGVDIPSLNIRDCAFQFEVYFSGIRGLRRCLPTFDVRLHRPRQYFKQN